MNRVLCVILVGLLLMAPIQAFSQSQHHDWITSLTDDKRTVFAYNINPEGSILMESCSSSSKKCTWLMANDTPCAKDASSPALVNSEKFSDTTTLICGGKFINDMYSYKFLDWGSINKFIRDARDMGIAISLPKNQFKIYRFSLFGMTEAQRETEEIWKIISSYNKKSHTNITGSRVKFNTNNICKILDNNHHCEMIFNFVI